MPIRGELVAGAVPQHVGMNLERPARLIIQLKEAGVKGAPRSLTPVSCSPSSRSICCGKQAT